MARRVAESCFGFDGILATLSVNVVICPTSADTIQLAWIPAKK
jgi:hypothetical protein